MEKENAFLLDLERHDIKPTATRLQILEQLHRGDEMLSLPRLEQLLPAVDKSTISRTLSLFLLHGLIHVVDDGSGSLKYNVSHRDCCHDEDEEAHTHFYCTRCHRTFCLKQIHVPTVTLPPGFTLSGVNYVLKGLCPECSEKVGTRA